MGENEGEPEMAAYLFVDTRAFEKLALQVECRVAKRSAVMKGYETYVIEQWACERRINTVIASYTGNEQHVVEVQVLLVPRELSQWSPITLAHFEELSRMHILPKETPLGNMLVTSLSSLPSNLLLVSLPPRFLEGYAHFSVNENLRRLNVVGRSAVTADAPSESLVAAFRRTFLCPASVNASYAVLEVATLMQIALFYFGLLAPHCVDGLLCDHTLKAVDQWWATFGRQRFRVAVPRPQDKLYMRISCAALLGTVTGARQRLSGLGLKPPKDPFDAELLVECVRRFQKLVKIPRTALLDEQTYFKLLQESGKPKALGSSNMLTAMKSTVKEGLSGKVSENLEDWETLDLDRFTQNARGARAKYLWQHRGEPTVPHMLSDLPMSKCGATTKIPLFSLAVDAPETTGPAVNSVTNSTTNLLSPEGPSAANSALPSAAASSTSIAGAAHDEETHLSLVNMFRKRKQSLGEPFDDAAASSHSLHLAHVAHPHFHKHEKPLEKSLDKSLDKSMDRSLDKSLDKPFDKPSDKNTEQRPGHRSPEHWFARPGLSTPTQESDQEPKLHFQQDKKGNDELRGPEARVTEHDGPDNALLLPTAVMLTADDAKTRGSRHHDQEKLVLRRTASLSEIDEVVFPVDSLAPLPGVLELFEEARALQCELKSRMERDEVVNEQLLSQIRTNRTALSELQRENVLIKYQVNASAKKREAVRRRVKELEAFMARLDYELAMLSVKLKDVDQSVLAFAAKVDAADAKWQQLKTVQVRPWWARWFA